MMEENVELLEPGNPKLKTSQQCVYRKGREYHKFNLKSMKVLDTINESAKSPSAEISRPTILSFERLFYFTRGINGEILDEVTGKGKFKDYCKDACLVTNCEYK